MEVCGLAPCGPCVIHAKDRPTPMNRGVKGWAPLKSREWTAAGLLNRGSCLSEAATDVLWLRDAVHSSLFADWLPVSAGSHDEIRTDVPFYTYARGKKKDCSCRMSGRLFWPVWCSVGDGNACACSLRRTGREYPGLRPGVSGVESRIHPPCALYLHLYILHTLRKTNIVWIVCGCSGQLRATRIQQTLLRANSLGAGGPPMPFRTPRRHSLAPAREPRWSARSRPHGHHSFPFCLCASCPCGRRPVRDGARKHAGNETTQDKQLLRPAAGHCLSSLSHERSVHLAAQWPSGH